MSHPKTLAALLMLCACGGPAELDPLLFTTPANLSLSIDGSAEVVLLRNYRDVNVRVTRIESQDDSLLLEHAPLPWRLGANREEPLTVSLRTGQVVDNALITIEGPRGAVTMTVGMLSCDADNDSYPSVDCGGDDCDDTSDQINPGMDEACNGVDDDCDGLVDQGLDIPLLYADNDGDRYGDPDIAIESCGAVDGFVANFGDCDDNNPRINPDADEYCNGIDDDCDLLTDYRAVDRIRGYQDNDGDGVGNSSVYTLVCPFEPGFARIGGDCDDLDATVLPAADEVCDGVDNDCDGLIDSDADDREWLYRDNDGDGSGDPNAVEFGCPADDGWVDNGDDCDDTQAERRPSALETCDGFDNDCDNDVDEGLADCLADCSVPVAHLPNTLDGWRTHDTPNVLDTAGPHVRGEGSFARAMAVGDLNLDGCDDIVVSARVPSPDGDRGVVYAVFGPVTNSVGLDSADLTWVGDDASFGESVAILTSDNNVQRVAVGAPTAMEAAIYVFDAETDGAGSTADATLTVSHPADSLMISTLVGSGDIDGDGTADLLVADTGPEDAVLWALSGQAFGDIDPTSGALFTVASDSPDLDATVLGDANADGFADVAVRGDVGTDTRLGIFLGPLSGALDLTTAPTSDSVGPLLTAAGDLDDDGLDDTLFTYRYDTLDGVRFGYQLTPSTNAFPWNVRADVGTEAAAMTGATADLDGDGLGDLAVNRSNGICDRPAHGTVSVGYGDQSFGTYLLGVDSRTLTAPTRGDSLGESLAMGDLNGDGIEDVVASMPGWDNASGTNGGGVFVLYGLPRRDALPPNALPSAEECAQTPPSEAASNGASFYEFCLTTSEPIAYSGATWEYDIQATVLAQGATSVGARFIHPGSANHTNCNTFQSLATLVGDDGITYELRTSAPARSELTVEVGQRLRIGLAGERINETSTQTLWHNEALADAQGLVFANHEGLDRWCLNPLSHLLWDVQDVCETSYSNRLTYSYRVGGVVSNGETVRVPSDSGPLLFRGSLNRRVTLNGQTGVAQKTFSVARAPEQTPDP